MTTPKGHGPSTRVVDNRRHTSAWAQDPRNQRLDKMWELKRAQPGSETEALMMAEPGDDAPPDVAAHPLQEVIAEALATFTETERDLLVMKTVEGLSIRDIAEVMRLSKSDVHRRLKPLLQRLTDLLKDHPEIREYLDG